MLQPGALSLTAQRWQPFSAVISFPGYDLTGSTFAAEVRAYRDAPGAALLTLGTALSVNTGAVPVSILTLSAPEVAIDALNFTNPVGGDLYLVWDLHITWLPIGKRRWMEGAFIIHAGSTQNG